MYLGPLYKKNELKSCVGFSDADWAEDLDDQLPDTYFSYVLQQSAGEVRNRHVLLSRLWKSNA